MTKVTQREHYVRERKVFMVFEHLKGMTKASGNFYGITV